ncbi:ribonuclease III [Rhodohalobacter halophilus]|uniref:ribonuclease III n=1 Tax=Rhodohalobacter halophilus TaxID=1812810 RepID=UPI000A07BB8C|nr:ribonuclease III [Rhodohalobacter halophilus]
MIERLREWFRRDQNFNQSESFTRINTLERSIGFSIPAKDRSVFLQALRHRSIVDNEQFESHETYERLEFLGDAVLDLIVTEILFEKYPTKNEGFLTKLRSKIVKGETLAIIANNLRLYDALEVGERSSGQGIEFSKSIMADVYESVIAAIYISKGYAFTYNFVLSNVNSFLDFETLENKVDNFKSLLMEHYQSQGASLPVYKVLSEEGPGHDKTFTVGVYFDDQKIGEGVGKSKKKAEQQAARVAIEELGIAKN